MNERRLEKRVELDATPEQVWEAVATGPGISAWFVPHDVEPREGGTVEMHFGSGFDVTARVTAWEPGRRFAHGSAETPPEGTADYAYEFLIIDGRDEGPDGGGTVLRFVQSGFLDEGWEDEYRGFDTGWDLFFGNLRSYLAHFAGRPVRNVVTMGFAGSADGLWPAVHRSLGLAGRPSVGERVTLRPDGVEPVTGVVDVASPEFVGVRSTAGLHRIGVEGCGLSAYHYFYGGPVDAAALTAGWQGWLDGLVTAAAGASAPAGGSGPRAAGGC